MVGRSYFTSGDEMPALRRYSPRGPGYAGSHDREPALSHEIYQSSRGQNIPSHDRISDRRSPDNDSASRPRSRIPVACGRCRKRKIKCSGDNGGPCTNCKQAQHDQCQFLRVSSQEAQMKTEVASYDYDLPSGVSSRMSCRMPLYGQHSFVPHSPVAVEASYPYRNNSLSSYQFPPKNYYSVPPFSDFSEGGALDYDIQGSSYQVFGAENLTMPTHYTSSGAPRGWNATPHLPRNSLFIEQSEAPYSHSQIGYHGSGFPLRTPIHPESRSLSLNGVSSSLSAPLTTDRLLPIPATQRQMPVAPFHRSTDSILPVSQLGYPTYPGDYLRSGLKAQNMHSVSENGSIASSYLPMTSSSPESIASSQLTYGSQQMSISQQQQQQQGEMYTPPGNDGLYATESPDSSYGHSGSGSKRGSHSSQASQADASSLPPIAADTLANGQRYVPYQSTNYPAPPINNMNNIPTSGVMHQTSIPVDN